MRESAFHSPSSPAHLQWMALPLLLAFGGCATSEDVRIDDRVAVLPSLRITHDFSDSPQSEETGRKARSAAELDLHYAFGTASQSIGASQSIDLGDSQFNGPADINADYDLFTGSLAFRGLVTDPADRLGIAVLVGLSVQEFALRLGAGTLAADERRRSLGPLVGLHLSFEPYSWLDLYVRATQALGFGNASTTLGAFELGLSVKPYSHVALAVGFRREIYRQPRLLTDWIGTTDSRIDLRLHGPMIGLEFDF